MKRMQDNTINQNIVQPLSKSSDDYGNPFYETDTNVFVFGPNDDFQSQYNSDDWNNKPNAQLNNVWGNIYANQIRTSYIETNSNGITMYNNQLAANEWSSYGMPHIQSSTLGDGDYMQSAIQFRLSTEHGRRITNLKFSYNGISCDGKSILNNNQYKIHSTTIVSTQADKPAYVFFQITDGSLKNANIQSLLDLYDYINNGQKHMLCTGCIGGKQIVGIYENKFVFADGTSSTKNWNQEIIDNGTFTIKDYIRAGV